MQYLDDAPAGGLVALVLGDIVFEAFEIPAKLTFGVKQQLVVQRFPGGGKEVQAMGADPTPLSWAGRFRGATAAEDAEAVARMAREGAVVRLSWSIFLYDVVVRSLSADFEAPYEVPYKIACEVVRDLGGDDAAADADAAGGDADAGNNAEALFLDDVDDLADGAAALAGTGLDAALAAANAAADAVADSGLLALAGDALAAAAVATPAGTRAAVAQALAAIGTAQALCATAVGCAALAAGTLPPGADPAAAAAGLAATAQALALAAAAQQAAWRLARLGSTLAAF